MSGRPFAHTSVSALQATYGASPGTVARSRTRTRPRPSGNQPSAVSASPSKQPPSRPESGISRTASGPTLLGRQPVYSSGRPATASSAPDLSGMWQPGWAGGPEPEAQPVKARQKKRGRPKTPAKKTPSPRKSPKSPSLRRRRSKPTSPSGAFTYSLLKARLASEDSGMAALRAGTTSNPESLVVIRVTDEARKLTKDFAESSDVLLEQMTYFRSYIEAAPSVGDLDISVQCDLLIFEWLMAYARAAAYPAGDPRPELTPALAVSILVSSEFLGMTTLSNEVLVYIRAHIDDILELPIDLSCISADLVARLAALFRPEDLDLLGSRERTLLPKLWAVQVRLLLGLDGDLMSAGPPPKTGAPPPPGSAAMCAYCGNLFPARSEAVCPKGDVVVDFHGSLEAGHVPTAKWSLLGYAQGLYRRGEPWRDLFWRLWGLTHVFQCGSCSLPFLAAQYRACGFHPEAALFEDGANTGVYPCCSVRVPRFELTSRPVRPCSLRNHSPVFDPARTTDLTILLARLDVIAGPGERPDFDIGYASSDDDLEPSLWGPSTASPLRSRRHRQPVRSHLGWDPAIALRLFSSDRPLDLDQDKSPLRKVKREPPPPARPDGRRIKKSTRGGGKATSRRKPKKAAPGGRPAARPPKRPSLRSRLDTLSPMRQRIFRLDFQRDDEVARMAALRDALFGLRTTDPTLEDT